MPIGKSNRYIKHFDIIRHFDTSVTPKVIGPSNDSQRHGRGTHLLGMEQLKNQLKIMLYGRTQAACNTSRQKRPQFV
jgi:hypothetical protein